MNSYEPTEEYEGESYEPPELVSPWSDIITKYLIGTAEAQILDRKIKREVISKHGH